MLKPCCIRAAWNLILLNQGKEMSNNSNLFAWACLKIKEAMDSQMHGNVIINFKGGEPMRAEIQRHEKPLLDEPTFK